VPLRNCTVVIHDLNETVHSLDVTAETLYEAIARALAVLSARDWVDEIGKGLTTVTVTIRHPEVTHVKIQDFENWLNRACKSPAETVLKMRLRQMLGVHKQ
jgi:exo-beta-1,3-glucanase (GH17 family)